ncbi:MAG: LysR family transcriptional regulator [Oscillibacter sp.]|jgi:molybdate transport system regulatory protein|nr:LysR family transcriptional regulator [Oscillibacter sp.]
MRNPFVLKLTLRLCLPSGERFFGPGVAVLLHRVESQHSLRAAAASMEMAYSKAWRIVHTCEEALGCKLLTSTIGGEHGGGAVLTEEGRALLSAYDRYCADVQAYCDQRFDAAFDHFRKPE